MGKPIGVAKLAKSMEESQLLAVTEDAYKCNEEGIDAFFSILQLPMTVEEAMEYETARKNLVATSTQVFRLINALN